MDEPHLLAAARHVERNPARADLCASAKDRPWSSADAQLRGRSDELIKVRPLLEHIPDWHGYLCAADSDGISVRIHLHSRTARRPPRRRRPAPEPTAAQREQLRQPVLIRLAPVHPLAPRVAEEQLIQPYARGQVRARDRVRQPAIKRLAGETERLVAALGDLHQRMHVGRVDRLGTECYG